MAVKGVLHILQIFSIEASPSDGLVSYTGHSLSVGVTYPSAEMQSVYSPAPNNWAGIFRGKIFGLCIFFVKIIG